MFDGDPSDPLAQQKLDFEQGFAFWNYRLVRDPMVYEFSDIDATEDHGKMKEIKTTLASNPINLEIESTHLLDLSHFYLAMNCFFFVLLPFF